MHSRRGCVPHHEVGENNMDQNIEATVRLWQDNVKEPDLAAELSELVKPGNEEQLSDAFYRTLAFGTACAAAWASAPTA